eukprot:COSAG06_NODE_2307_length_7109_cov_74.085877_6_plen_49_part_01
MQRRRVASCCAQPLSLLASRAAGLERTQQMEAHVAAGHRVRVAAVFDVM